MYNGIGLKTPRGSGTSGYVQRNLSFLPPRILNAAYNANQEYLRSASKRSNRRPDDAVFAVNARRSIESECFDLQRSLESLGTLSPAEIKVQVSARRSQLLAQQRLQQQQQDQESARLLVKDAEMERVRGALGISRDYSEGRAFDFETEEQRREREVASESQRRREAMNRLIGMR